MLELQNASLLRGTQLLFENANLTIYPGKHVGITGINGAGKSSLFLLILSQLELESGEIKIPSSWVISHVSQEIIDNELSAIDYVIKGDLELYDVLTKLKQVEEGQTDLDVALLHEKMDRIQGYSANSKAASLLSGLGFTQEQLSNAVKSFSGGWQMRLNLARALMTRSDILLLDEPTNHLDLDAVIWLEEYLKSYQGTLLLISHDRLFLDNVVNQIIHFNQKQLNLYNGNYSNFERQKAEKLALQQAGYEKQQKQIKHMQQFINRFKAKATKAKQAQSRIKSLEKLALIAPAHIDSPFNFQFQEVDNLPHTLLQLEQVCAGYNQNTILQNVNLQIFSGDRLGVLGANGQGKSTLIKIIAGELSKQSGERSINNKTSIGYFAQHQLSQLNLGDSAIDTLRRIDPKATEQALLNFLGGFNFSGDKVNQKTESFSGGEKARLVLACIVYQQPNLLLLDEPTNHLDLDMRDALTIALQSFSGALIVISHDRHLLKSVCDRFLLVSDKRVTEFDGDLDDYRIFLKQLNSDNKNSPTDSSPANNSKKLQRQQQAAQRKTLQPLNNKLKKLENKLSELNKSIADLDTKLNESSIYEENSKDTLEKTLQEHASVKQELQSTEEDWLDISEQIEQLKQDN